MKLSPVIRKFQPGLIFMHLTIITRQWGGLTLQVSINSPDSNAPLCSKYRREIHSRSLLAPERRGRLLERAADSLAPREQPCAQRRRAREAQVHHRVFPRLGPSGADNVSRRDGFTHNSSPFPCIKIATRARWAPSRCIGTRRPCSPSQRIDSIPTRIVVAAIISTSSVSASVST